MVVPTTVSMKYIAGLYGDPMPTEFSYYKGQVYYTSPTNPSTGTFVNQNPFDLSQFQGKYAVSTGLFADQNGNFRYTEAGSEIFNLNVGYNNSSSYTMTGNTLTSMKLNFYASSDTTDVNSSVFQVYVDNVLVYQNGGGNFNSTANISCSGKQNVRIYTWAQTSSTFSGNRSCQTDNTYLISRTGVNL